MAKEKELRTVIYTGTKTAFYHDRSYFPGETYQIPDEIPMRDSKGEYLYDENDKLITKPLVLTSKSKIRIATPEEIEFAKQDPRSRRRAVGVNAPTGRAAFSKSTQKPGTAPKL